MEFLSLHDKSEIETYLRQDVFLQIYPLGDLDDFFWPLTVWYGTKYQGHLNALIMLYLSHPAPTLQAFHHDPEVLRPLLQASLHLMPHHFYAHLSPGLASIFGEFYQVAPMGDHLKMGLTQSKDLAWDNEVFALGAENLDEIHHLYNRSYPGHWFDPRMLESGQYYAIRQQGKLASISGIHVYAPKYKVAGLGNITTLPRFRGQNLSQRVTSHLCHALFQNVEHIGLNVKKDNRAAIACYRKIGFEVVGEFEIFEMTKS